MQIAERDVLPDPTSYKTEYLGFTPCHRTYANCRGIHELYA